jgi:L-ascorbate metabolism protein UlaG (beta-lactamase superfamily)
MAIGFLSEPDPEENTMIKKLFAVALTVLIVSAGLCHAERTDVMKTDQGDLEITLLGHGSLMFKFQGKVLFVDPFSKVADYSKLPKADIILITHEHPDHTDPAAIAKIRTDKTLLAASKAAQEKIKDAVVMENGDTSAVGGFQVQAVPAYNIVHKRESGQPYHPKGRGNGYVISFANLKVYVAGDTEFVPEMKDLKGIDVAFLPVNLPYTMTAEMAAEAANAIKPRILYPYHFAMGNSDVSKLPEMLKNVSGIELRMTDKPGK